MKPKIFATLLLAAAGIACVPVAALASNMDGSGAGGANTGDTGYNSSGAYLLAGASVLRPTDSAIASKTEPSVTAGYAFNDRWAAELLATTSRYSLRAASHASGGFSGFTLRARPVEASVLYHAPCLAMLDGALAPYAGLGYAWVKTGSEVGLGTLAGADLSLESANGPLGRVGVDLRLDGGWFARADATYLDVSSRARLGGAIVSGPLAANAWQYSMQLGYAF